MKQNLKLRMDAFEKEWLEEFLSRYRVGPIKLKRKIHDARNSLEGEMIDNDYDLEATTQQMKISISDHLAVEDEAKLREELLKKPMIT